MATAATMRTYLLLIFFTSSYSFRLPLINLNFPMPSLPVPSRDFNIPPMFEMSNQEDDMPPFNDLFGQLEEMMPMADKNNSKVKTKKETRVKDGFEITTINKTGPGFFSFMSEMHSNGKQGNGTNKTNAIFNTKSFWDGESIWNDKMQDINAKNKCKKKCLPTEFCDPYVGQCKKRLSIGADCEMKHQCKSTLQCVWAKCQRAKRGDPGTFCKTRNECHKDSCCVKTDYSFHGLCTPRLDEGAICEKKSIEWPMVMSTRSNKINQKCNPCKDSLKCASVGFSTDKRCVKLSYLEQTV